MAYRDPNSPTTPTAINDLIAGMKQGEERRSTISANCLKSCSNFRSQLSRYWQGQYTTSTEKGDGWLWVKKL